MDTAKSTLEEVLQVRVRVRVSMLTCTRASLSRATLNRLTSTLFVFHFSCQLHVIPWIIAMIHMLYDTDIEYS